MPAATIHYCEGTKAAMCALFLVTSCTNLRLFVLTVIVLLPDREHHKIMIECRRLASCSCQIPQVSHPHTHTWLTAAFALALCNHH